MTDNQEQETTTTFDTLLQEAQALLDDIIRQGQELTRLAEEMQKTLRMEEQ